MASISKIKTLDGITYDLRDTRVDALQTRSYHVDASSSDSLKAVSINFNVANSNLTFSPLLLITDEDVLIVTADWSSASSSGAAATVIWQPLSSGKIRSTVYATAYASEGADVRLKIRFNTQVPQIAVISLDGMLSVYSVSYTQS